MGAHGKVPWWVSEPGSVGGSRGDRQYSDPHKEAGELIAENPGLSSDPIVNMKAVVTDAIASIGGRDYAMPSGGQQLQGDVAYAQSMIDVLVLQEKLALLAEVQRRIDANWQPEHSEGLGVATSIVQRLREGLSS